MTKAISDHIAAINNRIEQAALAAGRDPTNIRLVGVTKTVSPERVIEAAKAGIGIFGENYIQEAIPKIEAAPFPGLSWHFIGHLQSNKARLAVRYFDLIHSVDSLRLAQALDREAERLGKTQAVLIQVNLSGETTKSGAAEDAAMSLAAAAGQLKHLSVQGLMTMPPYDDDPEKARPYFKALARLRDRIAAAGLPGVDMTELSMGMSGDFEAAVAEGATLVRIGTAVFGGRP